MIICCRIVTGDANKASHVFMIQNQKIQHNDKLANIKLKITRDPQFKYTQR
jgi:hypothetical protein